jgi:hypothetical protein
MGGDPLMPRPYQPDDAMLPLDLGSDSTPQAQAPGIGSSCLVSVPVGRPTGSIPVALGSFIFPFNAPDAELMPIACR